MQLTEVHEALWGAAEVLDVLGSIPHLHGIAIDAPTIINNPTGQRPCETAVSRAYGSRHAGCHSSNLQNHADNAGLRVSSELQQQGYRYLASRTSRWQIECYPHPALIEFFELPERLVYKEGKNLRADDQRRGQKELARLIKKLERSPVLRLAIPNPLKRDYFSPSHIARKKRYIAESQRRRVGCSGLPLHCRTLSAGAEKSRVRQYGIRLHLRPRRQLHLTGRQGCDQSGVTRSNIPPTMGTSRP